VSLYAAASRPETFGIVLAESLPLLSGRPSAWTGFLDGINAWPSRIYLGMGGQETGRDPSKAERNRQYVEAARALEARLTAAGLGAGRRLLIVEEDAMHNEDAWARRLPAALKFLFPLSPESK